MTMIADPPAHHHARPQGPCSRQRTSCPFPAGRATFAKNLALRLVVPAVVLLAWWFTTSRDMVSVLIVPAPLDVVRRPQQLLAGRQMER